VPGAGSQEHYKPFANPRKFDGQLPVLWWDSGDTIDGVPVRSVAWRTLAGKGASRVHAGK
jgi:hypothetical protein